MSKRTEMTDSGLATYHSADFRTYEPKTYQRHDGSTITIQLCESFEEGRWEAFPAILKETR